jgi:hypothetical protein
MTRPCFSRPLRACSLALLVATLLGADGPCGASEGEGEGEEGEGEISYIFPCGDGSQIGPMDPNCADDADCAIVVVQVDACGSVRVNGVGASGLGLWQQQAQTCSASWADDGCEPALPLADDGSTNLDPNAAVVHCAGVNDATCETTFE